MANFNPELQGAYEEITREKYRRLAKKFHPDHGGSDDSMRELNAAYEEAQKGNFLNLDEMYANQFEKPQTPVETKPVLSAAEQKERDLQDYQKEQAELVIKDREEKERLYQEMQAEKEEAFAQHQKDSAEWEIQHKKEQKEWEREHARELEEAQKEKAA